MVKQSLRLKTLASTTCIFTRDKNFETNATLITFNFPSINYTNLPETKNQNRMNVFISSESPANSFFKMYRLPNDFFNATFTYMFDIDYPFLYNRFTNLTENDIDKWRDNEASVSLNNESL